MSSKKNSAGRQSNLFAFFQKTPKSEEPSKADKVRIDKLELEYKFYNSD